MLNARLTTGRKALCVALLVAYGLSLVIFAPLTVEAQCAMCKTAVNAGGEQAQRTMRTAMLVLLIPTVAIFCSIFVVFFKYGRGRGNDPGKDKDGRR